MKKFTSFFSSLLVFTVAMGQVPQLLKDINNGAGSSIPDFEKGAINWNGKLYFAADDGTTGNELWMTDGTSAGTTLLKDIYPGANGSDCQNFFATADFMFFTAYDGIHGLELWRTDGTAAGTQLIKDIRSGNANGVYAPSFSQPRWFYLWNDVLYFSGNEGTNGVELWKSDGTAAGTVLVKNINTSSFDSYPVDFEAYNGKLYFQARNSAGQELWVTDGTDAGTTLIKDINTGSFGSNPSDMVSCNGFLLFIADDDVAQLELWRSDGTAAGTVLVKDINPAQFGSGMQTSSNAAEKRLVKMGNKIYFSANDGTNGTELWASDGTGAGTVMVKDASTALPGYAPQNFAGLDDVLYYKYTDGVSGLELWRSDGTALGTYLVKDCRPGAQGAFFGNTVIAEAGGAIWFGAESSSSTGNELWTSDGTETGTIELADINTGSGESFPFQFISLSNLVIFGATGPAGTELYTIDLNAVPLSIDLMVTNNVACFGGASGALQLGIVGGAAPYTITWSPSVAQGQNPTNLPAGNYAVTVTDSNGATLTAQTQITQPTQIMTTTNSVAATYTNANGSASVTVTGGTPGYGYLWSNAATTSSINNVVANTYTVTITDGNGCTAIATVIVEMEIVPLVPSITITDGIACHGDADGALLLEIQGGLAPYSIAWNPSSVQGSSPSNLASGTYTATVMDATGVTSTATVTITEPPALSTTTSSVAATYTNANGSASVTITGGTPAYSYLWSNNATTASITNVVAGTYMVTVTDGNGCTTTATVTVDMETAAHEAFASSLQLAPTISTNHQFSLLTSGAQLSGLELRLTDSHGRLIQKWQDVSTGQQLSTEKQTLNGVYFVTVSNGYEVATKRVIFVN